MSSFSQINEKDNSTEGYDISDFLTPELCEDAGIILIDVENGVLNLGAMNLDYVKVKNVINTIENQFDLKVSLKQITSLEWETWFENTHSVSVEAIQKNLYQKELEEKITSREDISIETSKFIEEIPENN